MRTIIRLGTLGLLIAVALGAWWLRSARAKDAVAIRQNVEVTGATPEQLAIARWAVGRFEMAGLGAPAVRIAFHRDPVGCSGHLGLARMRHVDVCTVLVNAMSRRTLLHEMSHIWLDQHVGEDMRKRFLDLRDLPSWNASADPWALRGYEQGAEIISWAIGERILSAQIPYEEAQELDVAFQLLTGVGSGG
jgi:hypothetical protein